MECLRIAQKHTQAAVLRPTGRGTAHFSWDWYFSSNPLPKNLVAIKGIAVY